MHVCPQVTVLVPHVGGPIIPPCAPTVLIGGLPAARISDMLVCVGPPDAVAMGCPTVIVGMVGGGLGFGAVLSGLMAGLGNFASEVIAGVENLLLPPSPRPPLAQLQHAREMAALADSVYQDHGAPPGYTRLDDDPSNLPSMLRDQVFHDPVSGFDAALYRNDKTGTIVIAFRGTEITHWNDVSTDLKHAAGATTDQHDEATELANAVRAAYPDPAQSIEITGHSLGGGLAQIASAVTGYPATTFNAAGLNNATLSEYGTLPSDVVAQNYTVQGEIVTTGQRALPIPEALGDQITLEARGPDGNLLPAGVFSRHKMEAVENSLDYAIGQESQ